MLIKAKDDSYIDGILDFLNSELYRMEAEEYTPLVSRYSESRKGDSVLDIVSVKAIQRDIDIVSMRMNFINELVDFASFMQNGFQYSYDEPSPEKPTS
jgi:hypothetical protein